MSGRTELTGGDDRRARGVYADDESNEFRGGEDPGQDVRNVCDHHTGTDDNASSSGPGGDFLDMLPTMSADTHHPVLMNFPNVEYDPYLKREDMERSYGEAVGLYQQLRRATENLDQKLKEKIKLTRSLEGEVQRLQSPHEDHHVPKGKQSEAAVQSEPGDIAAPEAGKSEDRHAIEKSETPCDETGQREDTATHKAREVELRHPDFVARLPSETSKEILQLKHGPLVSKEEILVFMAGLIDQAYVPRDKKRTPAAGSAPFTPALHNDEYLTLPPDGRYRISKEALMDFVRDMISSYQQGTCP